MAPPPEPAPFARHEDEPAPETPARGEVASFTANDYNQETRRDAYQRARKLYAVLTWAGIIFLVAALLALLIIVGVLVWHYIVPEERLWLESERISKIESFFTGGITTGLVLLVREYLKPQP